MRRISIAAGAVVAGLALGWPAWAAVTWARFGRARRPSRPDPLLDRFLPTYDVTEHHAARVAASSSRTWAAATGLALQRLAVARVVIRWRERLLGVHGAAAWPPGGIVAQLRHWGWGVLAEVPGRAVLLGTVTQPWRGDVVFHALAPDAFIAFDRPGFVKLVTLIAVDPLGPEVCTARIETRVATTDATARARFRRYWSVFSPGIRLIRLAALRAVRREAESRGLRGDMGLQRDATRPPGA